MQDNDRLPAPPPSESQHMGVPEVHDPARKTLGALKEFARENLNVVGQYRDLVTPAKGNHEIRLTTPYSSGNRALRSHATDALVASPQ